MTDLSAAAITARLRAVAAATDLGSERRMRPKLDMTARGITARLGQVEQLRRLCVSLGAIGARARSSPSHG